MLSINQYDRYIGELLSIIQIVGLKKNKKYELDITIYADTQRNCKYIKFSMIYIGKDKEKYPHRFTYTLLLAIFDMKYWNELDKICEFFKLCIKEYKKKMKETQCFDTHIYIEKEIKY